MDPISNMLKQISTDIKSYLEARIDLLFLSVSETITKWVGQSVQKLLGLAIFLLGMVFVLTAASIAIGEWLENAWLGYLIMATPLLLAGVIMLCSKPSSLSKSIQKQLMSDILKSLDEKESQSTILLSPNKKEEIKE